jgi:hypothetical protein
MAIHVPFSQRPSGRQQSQVPVYIGFEQPRRRRRTVNWWGVNSILLFFLSLGALSPITLLMGLKGLRRRPRKAAIAGTLFSLVGVGIMATIFVGIVRHAEQRHHQRFLAEQHHINAVQIAETEDQLAFAASEFEEFRDSHEGQLPMDLDGNLLAIKHVDPWGESLRYEVESDQAVLRSAGPDGNFFSDDDLSYGIEGKTGFQFLLPVD